MSPVIDLTTGRALVHPPIAAGMSCTLAGIEKAADLLGMIRLLGHRGRHRPQLAIADETLCMEIGIDATPARVDAVTHFAATFREKGHVVVEHSMPLILGAELRQGLQVGEKAHSNLVSLPRRARVRHQDLEVRDKRGVDRQERRVVANRRLSFELKAAVLPLEHAAISFVAVNGVELIQFRALKVMLDDGRNDCALELGELRQ